MDVYIKTNYFCVSISPHVAVVWNTEHNVHVYPPSNGHLLCTLNRDTNIQKGEFIIGHIFTSDILKYSIVMIRLGKLRKHSNTNFQIDRSYQYGVKLNISAMDISVAVFLYDYHMASHNSYRYQE